MPRYVVKCSGCERKAELRLSFREFEETRTGAVRGLLEKRCEECGASGQVLVPSAFTFRM
jgi:hypothetical protein